MSFDNDSRCFLLETQNFTEEGYDNFKVNRQEYFTEYFSFGLPWLKLIVCIFGILTNILNIVVLTRPSISSSINILLAALESVNLFIYPTFFYEFAMFYNKDFVILFSETVSFISAISYSVYNLCICISNWLTVSVGVWRFIAITFPFKASTYCSASRSKIVVALICALSLAWWFYYFLSFECLLYVKQIINEDGDIIREIPVRLTGNWRFADVSQTFKRFYPIEILVSYAVPCIALAIVSIGLVVRLWKIRDERVAIRNQRATAKNCQAPSDNSAGEKRLTITLTAMILMYFLAFLSESAISVMYWSSYQTYIQTLFITRIAWSRCGILLCNSVTIFFYCAMSAKLRQTYVQILSSLICRTPNSKLKHGTSMGSTVTSQTSII